MRSVIFSYAQKATQDFADLFDGKGVFQNPKSYRDLHRLVSYLTEPGDVVFDFFAGSGTTGHAVMLASAETAPSRRFILVQLPEPLDPGDKQQRVAADFCDEMGVPRSIAELTKERLRRAGRRVHVEHPHAESDLGFRVFKLDTSNIRAWEPEPDDLDGTLLAHVEHIKPGRTEQDVLYELLLKLGLDLCVPIETREIAGKTVHSVGAGTLFVSLPDAVTQADAEALALGIVAWRDELAPAGDTTAVFRDSAFADDVAKTNLAAILTQHGMKTVRSL